MSRLADPTCCPDCRSDLTQDARCTGCGLVLGGPLAQQLWRTMVSADAMVERLRTLQTKDLDVARSSVSTVAGTGAAARRAHPPVEPTVASLPAAPRLGPPPVKNPPSRPGRTVPTILLTMGGLLVFVAVSLFLAVTWSVLPLGVKALIMAGFTAAVALGAVAVSRRGLRGSAETIWSLTAALVTLDLSAAYRADLGGMGSISTQAVTGMTGVLLVGLGLAAALWTRTSRIGHSIATEVVLCLGLLIVSTAWFWTGHWAGGAGELVGVVVLVAAAAAMRPRLHGAALASSALATVTWLLLAAHGWVAALDDGHAFTHGLPGWPLAAAAVIGAAAASASTLATVPRTVAAGGSLICLSLLALVTDPGGTTWVLIASGVLAALSATAVGRWPHWSTAAACLTGLGAMTALAGLAGSLLGRSVGFVGAHALWTSAPSVRFGVDHEPAAWSLFAVVAAGTLAGFAVLTYDERPARLRHGLVGALPGLGLITVATVLTGSGASLTWVLAAMMAALLASGAAVAVGPLHSQVPAAVLTSIAGLLALLLASRSDLLSALVATGMTLVALGLAVAGERGRTRLGTLAAPSTVLAAGYGVATWTHAVAPGGHTGAVLVAILAGGALLSVPYLLPRPVTRAAAECASMVVGAGSALLVLPDRAGLAVVLTLLGSAGALYAILQAERVWAGWAGSAILTLGTITRIGLEGRVAPELYALPAALLLLGAGVWRLLRERDLATWRMLGSGLSLALLPSLLIALPDPAQPRTLLVGIGAAAALVVGLLLSWRAPFVVGSGVLVVLALRFLLPLAAQILADPVGAWLLFGAAGAACLAAGILWEASLRNLRGASRFVTTLR